MNLRNTCPDIPDDWKGSVTDVCRLLGDEKPISPKTVWKYIRCGGVEPQRCANGRIRITGKQVKSLWRMI